MKFIRVTLTICIAIIASMTTQVHADITYSKYILLKQMKESGNAKHGHGANLLEHWLDGMASGLSWSESVARNNGQSVRLCVPDNLALSAEVVYSTIEQYLEKHSELKKDDTPMGVIAVWAVHAAFPCQNKP